MRNAFPDTRRLLTEITAQDSSTVDGQIAQAQWISDFVNRWGLGNVTMHPYPAGSPLAETGLQNVSIDVGGENAHDELLLAIAHLDVVKPSKGQEEGWDGSVFSKRGSADMLGQLAGFLLALGTISLWSRRRLRLLLTTSEERYSEGAFAAGHPTNNLTKGASVLLTGDINTGTRITDTPDLLIGNVGRVAANLQFMGSGRAHLPGDKIGKALAAISRFQYGDHPRDTFRIFPASQALAHTSEGDTHTGESPILIEIHYSNEGLTAEQIIAMTQAQLAPLLNGIEFRLIPENRGGVPFSKPWLMDHQHPYVAHATKYAGIATDSAVHHAVYRGSNDAHFIMASASRPDAHTKTTRLTAQGTIPAIGFYAAGEGVHGPHEKVNAESVERLAQFVRLLSAHEGLLTE